MYLTSDELFGLEILRGAVAYQRWVISTFGDRLRGRVLEVGAGNGNFTRFLAPIAESVVALEPEPVLREQLERMALSGVTVSPNKLEEVDPQAGLFDAVVMINVLEHIEDDAHALTCVHDLLEPGGRAFILVPAHQTLFGELDRSYGHFRRYSRQQTDRVVRAGGLRLERSGYFNPVGAAGWLWMGRVLQRSRIDATSVRLSEKVAVPVGRFLENIVDAPFGQSVVAVGVKGA